uniref:Pre-mRNA processing factor 40-like protein A n=1 Tax=Molossus molossus TaxID=27622 RepID=A0A7J8FTG5_MOLMO|nr:pre-mRNA processing factor 40-like protein A [Molossus molossus]
MRPGTGAERGGLMVSEMESHPPARGPGDGERRLSGSSLCSSSWVSADGFLRRRPSMGHPGMHYAPMGMHPMGQRANMPPVPHGMMPQMMPPMGGPPMGQKDKIKQFATARCFSLFWGLLFPWGQSRCLE